VPVPVLVFAMVPVLAPVLAQHQHPNLREHDSVNEDGR
jgi:hypothetical protein